MGSFNETCVLSGLSISYGDPVKLLFLTQNPYVVADQHEAKRGIYHYDNWFARTPPIDGKYEDYGSCEFKEDIVSDLILELFRKDVVERPFGFNRYHTCDVTKSKGIRHFLKAAWDGRLLVRDDYANNPYPIPDSWPTWEKVHDLVRGAGLFVQSDSDKEDGKERGFNAQPVVPGVVSVIYNSYEGEDKNLKKLQKILESHYDCKLVYRIPEHKNDPCLMVTVKGGLQDCSLLFDKEKMEDMLGYHPDINRRLGERQLPVLAVMARQDVWDSFCKVSVKEKSAYGLMSVDKIFEGVKNAIKKFGDGANGILKISDFIFREHFVSLPFMTTVGNHLALAMENGTLDDILIRRCVELARVEMIMNRLHRPWYIPPLGGQEDDWELHGKLFKSFVDICKKEKKRIDEY